MSRMVRKTKTRIENLIAWLFAGILLILVGAGVYWFALQAGVV